MINTDGPQLFTTFTFHNSPTRARCVDLKKLIHIIKNSVMEPVIVINPGRFCVCDVCFKHEMWNRLANIAPSFSSLTLFIRLFIVFSRSIEMGHTSKSVGLH